MEVRGRSLDLPEGMGVEGQRIPMGVGGGAEGKEAVFLQGRVGGQRPGSPWGDEG